MVIAKPKQLGVTSIEIVTDPVELAAFERQHVKFRLNWEWLKERLPTIYKDYRGKYLCVAGQELFVADHSEDAWAMARAAHPDDDGAFSRFIPLRKAPRI